MADDVRAQVDLLGALESVTLGVVSGRRLADVRERVGPAAEFVAGLHGLEIIGPSESFAHPSLKTVGPVIHDLLTRATRELSWCQVFARGQDLLPGLSCPPGAAGHGARALEAFAALAEPQIESGILKLLPGAKVYELLPAADWHKGRAVE
jgi:trehalose 6-phosphate phosphatase